ncbi:DEAD/DEAH box helicase [Treponema phagedenis]|uniref:DEAD/DEAH box helicase n=1 Tax=Treponema phagedenis TaxID=162 RepID=A0AAE6M970_TREPH|nr:DEAD/DEAH box helicase family protein [Treponema phagedenis]NVP23599.1 DEAD/DEAH box helicase family protein [Treponema phagedenis]QEJ98732.1 DEAD/DEAH box helicase [Treponema phagedenis]QEK04237.1 DEAD/DEAH box helicase [Treponema phagedenis]QEK09852.1 DEAD/DEAH box helicase [Treponema phagedenis]QLC58430.1 DEAD/DEAH box helicase family protein [Treponema phagedenis]
MLVELFPFQRKALQNLRMNTAEALGSYRRTHTPQVVSFTAPTGSGKTIIMAALFEAIFFGDETYPEQPEAIIVWLSDSPELNQQSKDKIDGKADKIMLSQTVTITDESFDQEKLEEGHIYFLNTQKLGKSSNLTKHGDNRQYTIWETLRNTAKEKSDRLYFVIDEAHRGMLVCEADRATTIMQKFLKGSPEDGLEPMPVVIGMSATTKRFNTLVEGTTSTIHKVVVTPDEVRASGLLKDRIVITYPEETAVRKDMAILQAATDEWKKKWLHWQQYCHEQHYAYVNPIFVVQVENATSGRISKTDLDEAFRTIENRAGYRFEKGEVVHAFGEKETININGLEVPYYEPSGINDNRKIKLVFFKESLSTGWDCPRAETMMSFRRANDSTYIAQLLGRMVRTPMQMRIQVDESLNDVHLFLPYFERNTVEEIVTALQASEGGEIPTNIYGEQIGEKTFETWSANPAISFKKKAVPQVDGQMSLEGFAVSHDSAPAEGITARFEDAAADELGTTVGRKSALLPDDSFLESAKEAIASSYKHLSLSKQVADQEEILPEDTLDREAIIKFINEAGLLTYHVRQTRINDYLTSLFKLTRLLVQSGLNPDAKDVIIDEIVIKIREYIHTLQEQGKYDDLVEKAKEFKLSMQVFDVFGESVKDLPIQQSFFSTNADIERQFRQAEVKLGREGVGNAYGNKYFDALDPDAYQLDVILFAADQENIEQLQIYAKDKFHQLNDEYRRYMVKVDESFRLQYGRIVSDGDQESKHNFRLPERIQAEYISGGEKYSDHLFVNDEGFAKIKLNDWEAGVLKEEQQRKDYVCWLRNPPRKSWALCIPYKMNNEWKSAYPDFLIMRKHERLGYIVDVLEPHSPDFADNLGKAKGFAEYARQNPGVGRIELIRMDKDIAGNKRFKRLDMSKSAIRDKVLKAMTNDEINRIFDTDGAF